MKQQWHASSKPNHKNVFITKKLLEITFTIYTQAQQFCKQGTHISVQHAAAIKRVNLKNFELVVSTTTWRRRVGCRRDTKGRWETEDRDLKLVSLLFFYLPVDQFARCTVWRRKREHIYIYLYIHISVYAIIIFCRVCSFDRAVLAIVHKWDKIEYSGDEAMNFESCRKQRYPPGKRYRSVNVGRISCPVTYASACRWIQWRILSVTVTC